MGENNFKPGEMDITAQEAAFDGFVKWSTRVAIASIAVVVFLALFAT